MLPGDSFDERLLHWIDGHRVDALNSFTTNVMDLTELKWFWVVVGVLGLAVVVYKKAWRVGLAVGIASYLGGAASGLLKSEFARWRPRYPDALVQVDSSYAMPSSHAAFTMAASIALLIVVGWRSRRSLVLAATGLALGLLLVGAMMIYIGAHWATDVFAGWALGIPIGVLAGLVFRPRDRST